MAHKIDRSTAETRLGSRYPAPYNVHCKDRRRTRLAATAGLKHFGINECVLPPGQWSSQRHWHADSDEFIMVLKGEVVMVTNDGEEVLRAGDCVGFPGGRGDAHHLQNRSQQDAVVLEVGSPLVDEVIYPDIDLRHGADGVYRHNDGTAY